MSSTDSHHFFTSESVTEGHPDKIADQVSDAVLDAILAEDDDARVACETLVTTGLLLLAGEITTGARVDLPEVARRTVRDIGYDDPAIGFDGDTCAVLTSIGRQSPDIAMGVDRGGAGDQGMMFGYATSETESLMPLPISLAHGLARRLSVVRRDGTLPWLRPDGKAQVTVEYDDDHPIRVSTVVVSCHHRPEPDNDTIREGIRREVIDPVLPPDLVDEKTLVRHINPTGRFEVGGPRGDAGVTGRKIIVDTYGGVGSHGGGAFSGKDPSKVDRSASYAARWVAKNVVAAGLAERMEIQVAYAIGVAEPVSIMVDTRGSGRVSDEDLVRAVGQVFDLRPEAIIEDLGLRRPIYRRTAAYGHFGRRPDEDGGFSWERIDRVDELRDAV
ncbi:MAG TPA: methionine adenosyltransferase [Gemmatimonadota bacterium]|nr:methionine adenosyltransferase [Gemmatimonadota bacterium]